MLNVAAYTGGLNVPSARYRVRQLMPEMLEHEINFKEYCTALSTYPPAFKPIRPLWGVAACAFRIPSVLASYRHDISFLQRELLSTMITLEPLLKKPCVLDVDDAIFLFRQGETAKKLASLSELIICGNNYLADNFSQWCDQITVIPTAVDTNKFIPDKKINNAEKKNIGWVGTSNNFQYLYRIAPALEIVLSKHKDVELKIISNKRPIFNSWLDKVVEFGHWTAKDEVSQIQKITIGIMPLNDGEWERGKCSFKMLQYMACGIPVVVSPVGMNKCVLSMGEIGFGASSQDEWVDSLDTLLNDPLTRQRLGNIGRTVVESNFSVEKIAKQLADTLKKIA